MKIIAKILGAIAGFVLFLNILTGTWVNLVTLHVLPAIHFGTLNVTAFALFGASTIFTLILSVGAFFLGGVYLSAFIGSFILKQFDPSIKISPWRIVWSIVWIMFIELVVHRKPFIYNIEARITDVKSSNKVLEDFLKNKIEKQASQGQGGRRVLFSFPQSNPQPDSSIPEKKQEEMTQEQ